MSLSRVRLIITSYTCIRAETFGYTVQKVSSDILLVREKLRLLKIEPSVNTLFSVVDIY